MFIRTRTTLESHDAQGKHTGTVTLPEGFLDFVTVHDQLHLARARAGAVELLDPGGTVVRTLALGEHAGIAIDATPDGSRWAVARDDGHVMVWGADATPLYTIAAHPARALSLALSPDGKLLATAVGPAAQGVPRGQDAAAAKLWNAETGAPIAELPGQQFEAADLSFSADSRHLLTLADAVRVWDGRGGLVLSIATLPGHTQAVSLSPDGLRLAVARGDARPELWDLERGVTTAALAGHTTQVGTRTMKDLLYYDELLDFEKKIPGFKFDISLSREEHIGDDPHFHKGYVHQVYLKEYKDRRPDLQFFICGWSKMIDEAVENIFGELKYDRKQIAYELYG